VFIRFCLAALLATGITFAQQQQLPKAQHPPTRDPAAVNVVSRSLTALGVETAAKAATGWSFHTSMASPSGTQTATWDVSGDEYFIYGGESTAGLRTSGHGTSAARKAGEGKTIPSYEAQSFIVPFTIGHLLAEQPESFQSASTVSSQATSMRSDLISRGVLRKAAPTPHNSGVRSGSRLPRRDIRRMALATASLRILANIRNDTIHKEKTASLPRACRLADAESRSSKTSLPEGTV